MIAQSKAALRSATRAVLSRMTPQQRAAAAADVCLRLEKQAVWAGAQSILCYAPLPEEPDVWRLVSDVVAAGKAIALPRFDEPSGRYIACRITNLETDVVPGRFGIREPSAACAVLALNRLDLILVPGIAFDLHGRRLGRGKGFYDQLLAGVRGTTCGVAFDEQIVGEIPVEPHDRRLNCIVTPTRWIEP